MNPNSNIYYYNSYDSSPSPESVSYANFDIKDENSFMPIDEYKLESQPKNIIGYTLVVVTLVAFLFLFLSPKPATNPTRPTYSPESPVRLPYSPLNPRIPTNLEGPFPPWAAPTSGPIGPTFWPTTNPPTTTNPPQTTTPPTANVPPRQPQNPTAPPTNPTVPPTWPTYQPRNPVPQNTPIKAPTSLPPTNPYNPPTPYPGIPSPTPWPQTPAPYNPYNRPQNPSPFAPYNTPGTPKNPYGPSPYPGPYNYPTNPAYPNPGAPTPYGPSPNPSPVNPTDYPTHPNPGPLQPTPGPVNPSPTGPTVPTPPSQPYNPFAPSTSSLNIDNCPPAGEIAQIQEDCRKQCDDMAAAAAADPSGCTKVTTYEISCQKDGNTVRIATCCNIETDTSACCVDPASCNCMKA